MSSPQTLFLPASSPLFTYTPALSSSPSGSQWTVANSTARDADISYIQSTATAGHLGDAYKNDGMGENVQVGLLGIPGRYLHSTKLVFGKMAD